MKNFIPKRCRSVSDVLKLYRDGLLEKDVSRFEDSLAGDRYTFLEIEEVSPVDHRVILFDERALETVRADNRFFMFRNIKTAPVNGKKYFREVGEVD